MGKRRSPEERLAESQRKTKLLENAVAQKKLKDEAKKLRQSGRK